MQSNKPLNSLSVEELLSRLDTAEDNAITASEDPYVNFLSFFNIVQGEQAVRAHFLLDLYNNWSKQPVKIVEFKQGLERLIFRRLNYFYIDKSALNLTEAAIKHFLEKPLPKKNKRRGTDNFPLFLKALSINDGPKWVESFVLYYLYDKYAYDRRHMHTLTESHFSRLLTERFKEKRFTSEGYLWVQVSDLSAHITREQITEIRTGRKQREKKNKKKRK